MLLQKLAQRARPHYGRRTLATLTKPGALSPNHSTAPLLTGRQMKSYENERRKEFDLFKSKGELDVVCGAVIERLPVILPDLDDWEVDFLELQQQQRLKKRKQYDVKEFSLRSGHDGNFRRDDAWALEHLSMETNGRLGPVAFDDRVKDFLAKQRAKGNPEDDEELTQAEEFMAAQKVEEDEDENDALSWGLQVRKETESEEAQTVAFRPNPRITQEDNTNDIKSVRRRLQRRLYLIVQVKDPSGMNGKPVWRFPMGVPEEGEVLLDAAKRNTESLCGGGMDLYYLARIPAGYTWFEYDHAKQQAKGGKIGAHVLFYRGQRLGGEVRLGPDALDFAWVTNDEIDQLVDNIDSDPYWSYARMFMED